MKKIVNIQNIITGMIYSSVFYSDETLNAWIAKQELKCASGKSWGWSERRMPLDQCPSNLQVLIVETYPVLISEDAGYKDWVRLKPEYEITITDVTEAHDAELASKEARLLELQQLRQAESIINSWTSLNDIGLPFLKKFFKRIIKEMRD